MDQYLQWKERLLGIVLFFWITLAPIRPALSCVILLPIVDLTLALICASKAGRPWTSRGFQRLVVKVACYEAATVLAFVVETWLTGPIIPLVKGVTGLIGVTELKSCLEHLDELNGSPFFAAVINKLAPKQDEDK